MKITKIEEQKKAKDRVSVFVDGRFSFGISANLLVDFDIYKGKEVSASEVEKFKEGDNISKCLAKAYRFLSYRPRSEKEMSDKLLEKYEPKVVEGVIERLKKYRYIDDCEFSRLWVESRRSGRSARAISYELQRKGVAKEKIEEALELLDKDAELEAALVLVRSKSKYQNLTRDEAYQKIGGFLSRRGYSYEIIKKVISELST